MESFSRRYCASADGTGQIHPPMTLSEGQRRSNLVLDITDFYLDVRRSSLPLHGTSNENIY